MSVSTFRFSFAEYTLSATVGELPATHSSLVEHAVVHDDFGVDAGDGTPLVITIQRSGEAWPALVISQRVAPGPEAGFYPGALIVDEHGIVFVGAGTRLLAYDLATRRRLWCDEANAGFWGWQRHGDVVVMSAELELAAWDARANKLWTTFVEPPWEYDVRDGTVHLDVMGKESSFPLRTGPSR